ncbi:hypothetical protein F4777DRAFT_558227 [Nemania sp. FL0916]|nr:hypothetical protein F4777DRAFT_558227 [Nemania sp. FL0916]
MPPINYADEEKDFSLWDEHKNVLEQLFLEKNYTLKNVKQEMETKFGFPMFPLARYETTLRDRYGFRKNLKRSDWPSLAYHTEKRKHLGKSSQVYLRGILQDPKKISKEIRRYSDRRGIREQVMRNHTPPPLPEYVLIRTPSPAPQRNYGAIVSTSPALQISINSEWINTLRAQTPSNRLIPILMGQITPDASMATVTKITRRLTTSDTNISPSLGEDSDLAMLSQACFILSNGLDTDSVFTKSLLKWIGISAEFSILKRLFSIKSPTIRAVWDSLYVSSVRLEQLRAYMILVELSLAINNGEWVIHKPTCLIEAVEMGATQVLEKLLMKSNMNLSSYGPYPMGRYQTDHGLFSPLGMAAWRCDLHAILILLNHGADANLALDPKERQRSMERRPLFAVLDSQGDDYKYTRSSFTSVIECTSALLNAGANVDILQDGWDSHRGWLGPGDPLWLIDYAWTRFPQAVELLARLSERSLKMQSEITVAGICLAANHGDQHLRQYLARRRPLINGKENTILQIALSEAAAHGLSEPVANLLHLGVDPNVNLIYSQEPTLEYEFPGYDCGGEWHPVVRAARGRHYHILKLLRDTCAYFKPIPVIKLFLCRDETVSMPTNTLSLVELLQPEIKHDGWRLILLILEMTNDEVFPICTQICDMAWSWGTPKYVGCQGRDALHYAIAKNCGLDMVKFLIARGYNVHSKPAYTYDHDFVGPSLEPYPQRSNPSSLPTMLDDALNSSSQDRLAIAEFLLEKSAEIRHLDEKHSSLWYLFSHRKPSSYPYIFEKNEFAKSYDRDSLKLFKEIFFTPGSANRTPRQVFNRGIMPAVGSLVLCEADDTLIFQVIDHVGDVNENGAGTEQLQAALENGRLAIADRLLTRGVHVDNLDGPRLFDHQWPFSAAHNNSRNRYIPVEFLERLIKLGADMNSPRMFHHREAMTGLHAAAGAGMLNVASLLLKYGANVNALTINECKTDIWNTGTPLDAAAARGRLDMVHLLRGAGGRSRSPGETGVEGARRRATKWGYHAIAEFLSS